MPLQDTLGSLLNPAASRNAILQRLGIDPNRAAGFGGNTQFDTQMADLYRTGLKTASDLDVEEGNLGRNYEQSSLQAALDRDKALKQLKGGFAQRGMSFSGAAVDAEAENQGNYDRYMSNLAADKEAGIGAVGRNRLNLDQGLMAGRQAAESGYGADLGAFLQQQAIDLWNSVIQQNQQNAMMQAMNRPAAPAAAPRPAAPQYPPANLWQPAPTARPATSTPVNMQSANKAGYTAPAPVKKPLTPIRGIY